MAITGSASSMKHLIRLAGVSWSLLSRREQFFFVLRAGARLALNGLDLVAVALMGLLGAITATGISGQSFELFGLTLPQPTASNVVALVSAVAFLFVVKGGLAILFTRWTSVFLAGIEIKNSAKIARHIFGGLLPTLRTYSRSEIGFLVGQSTNAAFSGVLGAATTLLIEGALFLSIFVMFMFVDFLAAVAIGVYFAVLVFLLQRTTSRRFVMAGRSMRQGTVGSGGSILEMADAFREIAVLSKQDFFLSRFIEARKLAARTSVRVQVMQAMPRYITESGLIFGALGFLIWQLSAGSLGEGLLALGIFLAGSFRMMGALLPLQHLWNQLRQSQDWVTMAQDVLVKLREKSEPLSADIYSPTLSSAQEEAPRKSIGFEVTLSDVSFQHEGSESLAVDGVSVRVKPGQLVAIVGPSGAGKTTLVDLILGLYKPSSGTVAVDGISPVELREMMPGRISYVPQKPGLVNITIADNVALGEQESKRDEQKVWEALERAQLAEHVRTLPDTIYSDLGSHSDQMSGGQLQRLGLARALYSSPNLVVLDEATSALDAVTEASIAEVIRNIGSQTTVIVIAHRLSTIQHADQVHVMDAGRILASGTFKQVRQRVPMIEEYVRLMSFDD